MNEIRLTKDADAMICVLYKEYVQRRKQGQTKRNARDFGGSELIHSQHMSRWAPEDVEDTCRELSNIGLLECGFADEAIYSVILSDEGIVYMENRFKDGLSSVFQHLETISSFLPW